MKIKLLKPATWRGNKHRSGSVHDVDQALAQKLIARDLAALHKDEEPDAPAASE